MTTHFDFEIKKITLRYLAMESTDSSQPSSITDTERKGEAVATVTNESSALEYERFLRLENEFSGASKKRLLRKRNFFTMMDLILEAHCT